MKLYLPTVTEMLEHKTYLGKIFKSDLRFLYFEVTEMVLVYLTVLTEFFHFYNKYFHWTNFKFLYENITRPPYCLF